MNQKGLVVALVLVIVAGVGAALYFGSRPPEVVEKTIESVSTGAAPEAETAAAQKKPVASATHSRWQRIGPGSVVGVVREYGSDRALEGVEVSLEAGLPGPNEFLKTKTAADGSFEFATVTNFDAWTFRAKAAPPLADTEMASVVVVETKVTDLGRIYLAPAFGVPGTVVDEKGTPVAGATVRAVRTRSASSSIDLLRLIRELPAHPPAIDTATSAENGAFELRKVPPGTYDFLVEKPGWQLKVEYGLVITPEARTQPLRFVLAHGLTLDGKVVRKGEGPLENLPVVAFREPKNTDFKVLDKSFATTDAHGLFHFDSLGAGEYVVAVTPEGEPSVGQDSITVPTKKPVEIVIQGDAWLEGNVTAEEAKPVPDAWVYALALDGHAPIVATVKTDAAGHYAIHGLRSGSLQFFLVQAEGFGAYPEDLMAMFQGGGASSVNLVPGRNERNVSLAKGAVVRGTVKEKGAETPIAGARVEVGSALAILGGNRGATTGADGKFEITGVGKGTSILLVSKEGWFEPGVTAQSALMVLFSRAGGAGGGKDAGKGATIVVSEAGEVIERTIELARGSSLSGRVLAPDGTSIRGAQVSLVPDGGGNGMMNALAALLPAPDPRLSDAEGRYQIPGPAPGQKSRVVARAQGYLDGRSDPISCNAGDAKDGVDVKLRVGATLTGRVHEEGGRPVDGALVRWIAVGDEENKWSLRWRLRNATPTLADANGQFKIVNVETGKLMVEVSETRHLPFMAQDVETVDGQSNEIDATLAAGATIEGRVLGADGVPKEGARVSGSRLREAPSQEDTFDENPDVTTDASGNFRAEGLAPGRYSLQAHAEGCAPSDPQEVATGSSPIVLRLAQAFTISGTVRAKGAASVAGVHVAAVKRMPHAASADGSSSGESEQEVEETQTGANGAFELKNLPAGTYDLRVTVGWGPSPRPNVVPTTVKDVAAGQQQVVIEVDSGLTIVGTVVGEDGKPAASGWVWANAEDAALHFPGVNAQVQDGRFELTGLPPGKYQVTVGIDQDTQKTVTAEAGREARVDFAASGRIRVVVKKDGNAVAGASVWARSDQCMVSGHTDEAGVVELKCLGEGSYSVEAHQGGDGDVEENQDRNFHAKRENVSVRVHEVADLELQLEKQP